jgi:hypothetical protein
MFEAKCNVQRTAFAYKGCILTVRTILRNYICQSGGGKTTARCSAALDSTAAKLPWAKLDPRL